MINYSMQKPFVDSDGFFVPVVFILAPIGAIRRAVRKAGTWITKTPKPFASKNK